jgi:hypothetical protein
MRCTATYGNTRSDDTQVRFVSGCLRSCREMRYFSHARTQ